MSKLRSNYDIYYPLHSQLQKRIKSGQKYILFGKKNLESKVQVQISRLSLKMVGLCGLPDTGGIGASDRTINLASEKSKEERGNPMLRCWVFIYQRNFGGGNKNRGGAKIEGRPENKVWRIQMFTKLSICGNKWALLKMWFIFLEWGKTAAESSRGLPSATQSPPPALCLRQEQRVVRCGAKTKYIATSPFWRGDVGMQATIVSDRKAEC